MVDFKKLLGKAPVTDEVDPLSIFERLDKESGKEYLRPPQVNVLRDWHQNHRTKRDIIVKLHTGQGKTLISLLILKSGMNEGLGPAIYICPNNYLVKQTIEQARAFGIRTVEFTDASLPLDFLNSQAILVTNCKKMFNGKSVFGVAGSGREQIQLGTIALDDAHKCVDIIRDSFSINVKRYDSHKSKSQLFEELWNLFQNSLQRQAPGTYLDVDHGDESLMAVPFWTWFDKQDEVLGILRKYKDTPDLLFVWDLLKDKLAQCMCIFSGTRLQITPRLIPVEMIPSFAEAKRRIFLSATLTEDAFLVRDLGIDPSSVADPLTSPEVKYSGERMILIPTLVDPTLTREQSIQWISGLASKHKNFGVVSIVPSFKHALFWEKFGAITTNVQNLDENIDQLKDRIKQKNSKAVVVLVNEYDGVDLPDNTCRILCLDSLPSYNSLIDTYFQQARPNSAVIRRQMAQRVEQGIGRAIRGSSDWCIVVVTGNSLTDFLSEKAKRAYLSGEAQTQIKIAEELAEEMKSEGRGLAVMEKLLNQCVDRDALWKEYYREKMDQIKATKPDSAYLARNMQEREAEVLVQQGRYQQAIEALQGLASASDKVDRGWYLQLMATYLYPFNPTASMDKQVKAHSENYRLSRPEAGISYSKLESVSSSRESLIIDWVRKYESYNALLISLVGILEKLSFNSSSDVFEEGVDELGRALGFTTQRPEKQSGLGPDNLWHITGKNYWIISCKNMVSASRTGISKHEIGQLNNDIGWFMENYPNEVAIPVFVHPASTLGSAAFPTRTCWVINRDSLEKLKKNTKGFYNSLNGFGIESLSPEIIRQKLKAASLDLDDLSKEYLKRIS